MAESKSSPATVLEFVRENGAKLLDLRFTDLPGLWHHVSFPIELARRGNVNGPGNLMRDFGVCCAQAAIELMKERQPRGRRIFMTVTATKMPFVGRG